MFVQTPREIAPDVTNLAGPLARFVRNGDLRGLNALLFMIAITSSGASEDGWSTTLPVGVWARAFGTTISAELPASRTAVSKIFRRLEERQLIQRSRRGKARQVRIGLLREDGSARPYTRPDGNSLEERFFTVNHALWLDGWSERLKLPALAMLLVALHETGPKKPSFELATEHCPRWYGWSADTAERGLQELRAHGLLEVDQHVRKEPLSDVGYVRINSYQPRAPFNPKSVTASAEPTLEEKK